MTSAEDATGLAALSALCRMSSAADTTGLARPVEVTATRTRRSRKLVRIFDAALYVKYGVVR